MNKPDVIIAVDDLIFLSKIQAASREAGVSIEIMATPDEVEKKLQGRQSMLIVDLNAEKFSPLELIDRVRKSSTSADTKIVGFFSHMQMELKKRAERLGCDLVLPKSRFIVELASLLRKT